MKKSLLIGWCAIVALCAGGFFTAVAGTSPYFKVPVTYYDFHNNNSNPEFFSGSLSNCATRISEIQTGWLVSKLDNSRNVQLSPAFIDSNCMNHVAKWFVPWTAGDQDTNGSIISDTLFKNVSVPDSFKFVSMENDTVMTFDTTATITPFVLDGDTIWYDTVLTFDTTRSFISTPGFFAAGSKNKFYPLNDKGFCNEGLSNNDCYTMKMSNRFTFHTNDSIYASGDDDVWIFINDSLFLDIGGWHGDMGSGKSLNGFGLTTGQQYDIDVFWAERFAGGQMYIKTNLSFVTKREGFDTTITSVLSPEASVIQHLVIGKNGILRLPLTTASVKIAAYAVNGAKIASFEGPATCDLSVNVKSFVPRTAGMVVLEVTCFNSMGNRIQQATQKLPFVY